MDDYMEGVQGIHIPVYMYWILLLVFLCVGGYLLYRSHVKYELKKQTAVVYMLTAALLALLFGRLIYTAVRFDWIFMDGMGEFLGILPFIDPSVGGLNATGIIIGCLLAGLVTARITKQKAGVILDTVVPYAVLLFALMRLIEPITGQGFGDMIQQPLLPLYPFGFPNDWGDWQLPVCAIEGLLAALAGIALFILRSKTKKAGTLTLYALVLLCASQIIPQSLRQDDVLMIFIFARINQIGFITLLCGSMFYAGAKALRRGESRRKIGWEWTAMITGVLLAIGCEYALDKTNLPDLLVYIVMLAVLAAMSILSIRRIHREDIA